MIYIKSKGNNKIIKLNNYSLNFNKLKNSLT